MTEWRQTSEMCICRMSYYVRDGCCNKCGVKRNVYEREYQSFFRKNQRKLWSKAKHRYLTEDEINRGEKGG